MVSLAGRGFESLRLHFKPLLLIVTRVFLFIGYHEVVGLYELDLKKPLR